MYWLLEHTCNCDCHFTTFSVYKHSCCELAGCSDNLILISFDASSSLLCVFVVTMATFCWILMDILYILTLVSFSQIHQERILDLKLLPSN